MVILGLTVVGLMLASAVNTEEVVNYRMCPNTDCLVYDLYVYPCPQALHNQPCEWKQNSNTSIAFKYNPDFGAAIPLTQLSSVTIFMDLPFLDIDMNACLYTHCPIKKDTEQYWLYNLFVPKDYEFDANQPRTYLYTETWLTDYPIMRVDPNACLYTSCPVKKDTEKYWRYNLFIPESYDKTYYTVKFVLRDANHYLHCCLTFDINII